MFARAINNTVSSFLKTNKALQRVLSKVPYQPLPKLDRSSILYGDDFLLRVWRAHKHIGCALVGKGKTNIDRPKDILSNLVLETRLEGTAKISITQLHGFVIFVSTSTDRHGNRFKNLSEFANDLLLPGESDYCEPTILFGSDQDFKTNIRLLRERVGMPIKIYYREWDQKYFYALEDGTHYIAAIYRQCKEQNKSFYFDAQLTLVSINLEAALRFVEEFESFVLPYEACLEITEILRAFQVRYVVGASDIGHRYIVLFLSRPHARRDSARFEVVKAILKRGAFDFGEYIGNLCGSCEMESVQADRNSAVAGR